MKRIRLVVREADQDWSGLVTYGQSERAIAGLNADPETFGELDIAIGGYAKRLSREQLFLPELEPGEDATPGDLGVVIIDLAARLIVVDREEELFEHRAGARYFNGETETEHVLGFTLTDEWLITCDLANWREIADQRRQERASRTELDVRAVLYGPPLLKFIAREIFAAYPQRESVPIPEPRWADETEESRRICRDEEFVRKIHASWMLMPRQEFAGKTPREMMFARRREISRNMQDREHNWSLTEIPPAPLPVDSHAYLFGGIGTQEAVTYYYVVRDLIWSSWLQMEELTSAQAKSGPTYWTAGDFLMAEVPRLATEMERILKEPHGEFEGRSPWSINENERRRMPEGGSYRDHMIDPDCPCCQMLADMGGVGFWSLDGCNMDHEFAFDIHHETQEEWDEEQREWAEFNRKFKEKEEEQKRLEVGSRWSKPPEDSVWSRSIHIDGREDIPLGIRLFVIGCELAELIVDIRDGVPREQVPRESQAHIDRLNRDFGNLRELLQSADVSVSAALLEPSIELFKRSLDELAAVRPELEEDCTSLARQLDRILNPPPPKSPDEPGWEAQDFDDIPF